jgi:hypothetical protein
MSSSTILVATSTTRGVTSTEPTSTPGATASTVVTAGSGGAATASEAVAKQLPEGWITKLVDDGRKSKTYWAGPLNSEWATVYVVTLVQGSEHR